MNTPPSLAQVDQVTNAQFRNGLSQLGLQVDGSEADILCKKFAGAPGFVNFVSFACAIDESQVSLLVGWESGGKGVRQALRVGWGAARMANIVTERRRCCTAVPPCYAVCPVSGHFCSS